MKPDYKKILADTLANLSRRNVDIFKAMLLLVESFPRHTQPKEVETEQRFLLYYTLSAFAKEQADNDGNYNLCNAIQLLANSVIDGVSSNDIPPYIQLTLQDIEGIYTTEMKRLSDGMIVAEGYGYEPETFAKVQEVGNFHPQVCPIWGDTIPNRSATIVCRKERAVEVKRLLSIEYGDTAFEKQEDQPNGFVAIRTKLQR